MAAPIEILAFNFVLAVTLFWIVNWVGRHSTEFGYASLTLFRDVNEALALNFIIRSQSPTIFIVAVAALLIVVRQEQFRIGLYLVPVIYFALRASVILVLGRQLLVNWPRYLVQVAFGLLTAIWAYENLIVPKKSLVPDLSTAGNELWLAIAAFLYAVANKVQTSDGPTARRRNQYLKKRFQAVRNRYRTLVEGSSSHMTLQLLMYAIIIYEDYARPAPLRTVERLLHPHFAKSLGVMQVTSETKISDRESVIMGVQRLSHAWSQFEAEAAGDMYDVVRSTIGSYNKDDDYISAVMEIMEILSIRIAPEFENAYKAIWPE